MTKSSGTILDGASRPEGRGTGTVPRNVSLVLDRREFLLGVLTTAVWRISFSGDGAAAPATIDWAVDHIFGPYPPYAHPIPYIRQPVDPGVIDPYLLI